MGKDKPVGTAQQVWHYPSRSQCMDCHTRYAGRSLGPSTQQLNSEFAYADGAMNQIAKLTQLGLFEAAPKDMTGYPDPLASDATLEERARSYIQSNCAICHRPGGEFSSIDMRYATTLADSKLCDKVERDAGKVPDYRLTPGKPAESTMSFRMHTLEMTRMPQIASLVVDLKGTQLVDDWIAALPTDACPPRQ
jgi:cytochrome c551/c552